MFYVKTQLANVELKIDLYADEIFTNCNCCGKEIEVDSQILISVLQDGDLASTSLACEECTSKSRKEITQ